MTFTFVSLACLAVALWFPAGRRFAPLRAPYAPSSGNEGATSLDHLLVLRFFACLLVFLIHVSIFTPHIYDQVWPLWGHNLIWIIHAPGQIGVGIFFTLSGYLMAKGFFCHKYELSRDGFRKFLRNRALRIIPLYYFNILVVALFVEPRLLTNHGVAEIASLATFTYHANATYNANQALWTISTEMEFYAVVPILALATLRLDKSRTIIAAILVWLALGPLIRLALWQHLGESIVHWNDAIYTQVYGNADCFACGFLLCPLLIRRGPKKSAIFPAYALLPVLYLAGSLWYYQAMHLGIGTRIYVVLFPTAAVITALIFIYLMDPDPMARGTPLSLQAIKKRPIRAFEIGGVLTYSIYVWHPLILAKLSGVLHGSPVVFYLRLLTFGMLLTGVFALVTFLCIERSVDKARS
jgi:peptidoglycan/LPS O-acetylase OafA/YrhL